MTKVYLWPIACLIAVLLIYPNLNISTSKGSELDQAKIHLMGLHTVLKQAKVDYGAYLPCFEILGFMPSLDKKERNFSLGILNYNISEHAKKLVLDKGLNEKCFESPQIFFQDGLDIIKRDEFPSDATLEVIDKLPGRFKLVAMVKAKAHVWTLSLDQDKKYELKKKKWVTTSPFEEIISVKEESSAFFRVLKTSLVCILLLELIFISFFYVNSKWILFIEFIGKIIITSYLCFKEDVLINWGYKISYVPLALMCSVFLISFIIKLNSRRLTDYFQKKRD